MACKLGLDDRMDSLARKQAFITLKDHKDNFVNSPTCRLINHTKSKMGRVSKQILDNINTRVRSATAVNQWRNSTSVVDWFKGIPDKSKCKFIVFDIVNFYPSITEDLLRRAITFARQHTSVQEEDVEVIMHARKSLLFDKELPWVKRQNKGIFDVTMGSYDGAEICELVSLYALNLLAHKYSKDQIGLYRDDGLAAFKNISGGKAEKIKKDITRIFKDLGLKITIETNLKIVNYLDLTLNLSDGKFYPYRKPDDQPVYIHKLSNHPPPIIKHLPAAISRRISDISSDEGVFNRAAPLYNRALEASGYSEKVQYEGMKNERKQNRKTRKRQILYFNPPYNRAVVSQVGKSFLHLIDKHFRNSSLGKIFNRNNVKVSYSCTENMACVIRSHNRQFTDGQNKTLDPCNCRVKGSCPLSGSCQASSIVYKANVMTDDGSSKYYVGLTENKFKLRHSSHVYSFKHIKHEHTTELSKHVWGLKAKGKPYEIKWSILSRAAPYTNASKRCQLCHTEKLKIISGDKPCLLNKRSEMISKCRHENKFLLSSYRTTHPYRNHQSTQRTGNSKTKDGLKVS